MKMMIRAACIDCGRPRHAKDRHRRCATCRSRNRTTAQRERAKELRTERQRITPEGQDPEIRAYLATVPEVDETVAEQTQRVIDGCYHDLTWWPFPGRACFGCGGTGRPLEMHHSPQDEALVARWMCHACHCHLRL